jgi:ABC-type transport system substrate-binding protein
VLNESAPPALVERYQADPELKPRLLLYPQDWLFFAAMNLAQPPFDDVHVRRAANLAVDKAAIRDLYVPVGARIATHFGLDSHEGNLLVDYDPYATPGHSGDLAAARAEMAASRYDADGDGRCDRPECSGIRAVGIEVGPGGPLPDEVMELVRRDLEPLGLELLVDRAPPEEAFPALAQHAERYGIVLNTGWAKDFPNGSGWFTGALDSDEPHANPSLVGLDPDQLAEWGYPVTSVPSVDDELAECLRLVGGAQTQCWAALDQLVMEQIVPLIPYVSPHETRIVSTRAASISIDQLTLLPSLDRIALEPGS